jgi:trehalose 6-phosphate synthase
MGNGQRIVLVSNRLPPSENLIGEKDVAERPVSGLVSALRPVLGHTESLWSESLWFGWSGRSSSGSEDYAVTVSDLGLGQFVALDLPRREASLFYTGFSNRTLWPLLHNFPDRIVVKSDSYTAYRRVNRRFAESLSAYLRPDDTLWVHDFHLIPLGAALRDVGWTGKIGFFLHVPFPSVDTFTILPWARDLLQDLVVYDLVGLQTRSHAHNLMHTLIEELRGAQIGDAFVYGGRRCRIGVYPVGTDPDAFRRVAAVRRGTRAVSGLKRLYHDQKVVLGVDRLDYTKGVPQRLLTFEHLLERRPSLRGKVGLVQISVPSRERVPEYAVEKRRTDEIVGRINGRFSRGQWIPVNFLYRSFTQQELTGFYNEADVCLVTPIRDGMNLVAKEYVASRGTRPGVLVLSKFCGAAETMTDALIVNPHDVKGTADAVHQGITMPDRERARRWTRLVDEVETNTATAWAESFLRDLAES